MKETIFYCPFIDNNGTKCSTWHQFDALFTSNRFKYTPNNGGIEWLRLSEQPDTVSMVCVGNSVSEALKMGLEGLLWLKDVGGEFNAFDKRYKKGQSDGLYINDMIWRLRQLKKLITSWPEFMIIDILMIRTLLIVLALLGCLCESDFFTVVSLSKTLYIPGQFYSLINFTQSVQPLSDYFNISIGFTL